MSAHSHAFTDRAPNWYSKSGIVPCDTCDGRGYHEKRPWLHVSDPDNWDEDCPDCCGTGHFACAVCGFDTPITGYDCFACDSVNSLVPAELAAIDPADFAAAFTRSIEAARGEVACG